MFQNSIRLTLCLIIYTFLLGTILENQVLAETLYLKVRTTKLRLEPSALSKSIRTLNYGDSLDKVGEETGWFKVKTRDNKLGFIHPSVVSPKHIVLSGKEVPGGNTPDSSELVLAGKGFNSKVEKQFAAANGKLNFKAVDQMERLTVSDAELVSFIKDGKLKNRE